jgi:hypothetical protein
MSRLILVVILLVGCITTSAQEFKSISNWSADWKVGGESAYATKSGNLIRIGNRYLERVFRVVHDTVATSQRINKVSKSDADIMQSTEFGLVLTGAINAELTAADFKLTGVSTSESDKSLRVIFSLEARATPKLTVQLIVETFPDRSYQRKWLTIDYKGDDDVIVQQIDVERTGGLGWWNIANPTHMGMGQPIFVADLYMGLEYVAGDCDLNSIRHYPGRSARGGLTSKSAIWGVAKNHDDLRRAFFDDYLYTLDGVKRAEPFVIWNMIGSGVPEEQKYLKAVEPIAQHAKAAGITLDSIAIDDPWTDVSSIWQPDPQKFPGGLDPFSEKVQGLGSHLGLWLSVMGLGLDTHWGNVLGMEVTKLADRNLGGQYCMAGPKYKAAITKTLVDYVQKQKVNYFKLDYNSFGCDVATHGHPVGANVGREAQIDAFLDILHAVKSADPNCKIALTTGMWLSPWWIQHADYIWLGGSDVETAKLRNLTPQDSNTSGRDIMMYDDYRKNEYVFPTCNLMTHGFWENGGASYAKWQDDVIMTIGRGIAKWEVLNADASMDEKRWHFLGRTIRWGKANWDTLRNTEMILGDPGKGEVYGYTHVGPKCAILVLRNPDIESKSIDLSLADLKLAVVDWISNAQKLTAHEIYPAANELDWPNAKSPLHIELLGSQTKVIAIVADPTILDRLKL